MNKEVLTTYVRIRPPVAAYLSLCLLALFAVGLQATQITELPEDVEEAIKHINSKQSSWTAGHTVHSYKSDKEFSVLMGVRLHPNSQLQRLAERESPDLSADDLPESFDSRAKWSQCKSLNTIRDQGNCGSCWAFAGVESMSDRLCIHSEGKIQVELSPQDLLSCCYFCGNGCGGGNPGMAWKYWSYFGLVTGGDANSKQGCRPYSLQPCKGKGCESKTPRCTRNCEAGYAKSYRKDRYYGKTEYSVRSNEEDIMREIYTNGPVEAAFQVYADFKHYTKGVYKYVSGAYQGGHAVRILGWGVEDGQKYWLVANSWNTSWGLDGYFKILRGSNECGIEGSIVAGLPSV